MAKLLILAITLALVLLVANTSAYRTTITTVEVDDSTVSRPSQQCQREIERQDLNNCEQYIRQQLRNQQQQHQQQQQRQQQQQQCCQDLQNLEDQCQCEALEQIFQQEKQQVQRQGQGQGRSQQLQQVAQQLQNLPQRCQTGSQRCQIQASVLMF